MTGFRTVFAITLGGMCSRCPPPTNADAPAASSPAGAVPSSPRAASAPDFVDRQLTLRGAQFAGALLPDGLPVRGTLPQGANASHDVPIMGGHCYRIMAVGGVDVNDLDLALHGPDGSELDSDTQSDNYPVIGAVRPFCPPNGGRYRVEVRMRSGHGDYGLEIFRTP